MTDKQLEEYTRLKIKEATQELQDKYDRLSVSSKEYKSTMYFSNGTVHNSYKDIDDLTKELKEMNDLNKKLKEDNEFLINKEKNTNDKYESNLKELVSQNVIACEHQKLLLNYLNDTLFNRLKKAFKGEL